MPFKPGESGNPGGRPKSVKLFRDALSVAINRTDGDKTQLAKIAEALVTKATEGDVPAIREIADRMDGKVPQGIGGDEDNPVVLVHRIENIIVDPKA